MYHSIIRSNCKWIMNIHRSTWVCSSPIVIAHLMATLTLTNFKMILSIHNSKHSSSNNNNNNRLKLLITSKKIFATYHKILTKTRLTTKMKINNFCHKLTRNYLEIATIKRFNRINLNNNINMMQLVHHLINLSNCSRIIFLLKRN